MSALSGLRPPIWANEVERQLIWRTLHHRREALQEDMGVLEERMRTHGHDREASAAWHVLDAEQHMLGEIGARIMEAAPPPPEPPKILPGEAQRALIARELGLTKTDTAPGGKPQGDKPESDP